MLCGIGLSYQKNTICAEWLDGLHSTCTSAMWDAGFHINEKTIPLSRHMAFTVKALVLCGIWGFLSIEDQLRWVGGRAAQYRHWCLVDLGFLINETTVALMVCTIEATVLT